MLTVSNFSMSVHSSTQTRPRCPDPASRVHIITHHSSLTHSPEFLLQSIIYLAPLCFGPVTSASNFPFLSSFIPTLHPIRPIDEPLTYLSHTIHRPPAYISYPISSSIFPVRPRSRPNPQQHQRRARVHHIPRPNQDLLDGGADHVTAPVSVSGHGDLELHGLENGDGLVGRGDALAFGDDDFPHVRVDGGSDGVD